MSTKNVIHEYKGTPLELIDHIPPEVRFALDDEHGEWWRDDLSEVTIMRAPQVAPGIIVVPSHGWDLREANLKFMMVNVVEAGEWEAFAGPGIRVFHKDHPVQKSYGALYYNDDGLVLFFEW